MITLHGFGPRLGLPDASPFVLKIDAYLRMAGLPYKHVPGIANLRKSPKGKLPFITDDGELVADSTFIIHHLQTKYSCKLDDHLNDTQRANAFMLRSMLEEKLYWCTLYFRWVDKAGWAQVKPLFFGDMPIVLRDIVASVVRRGTRNAIQKQGMGRHQPDELVQIARECFSSIATILPADQFLFGDKPCSTDATLYAFLAQATLAEINTPINSMAGEFPPLKSYCENFRQIYYNDKSG